MSYPFFLNHTFISFILVISISMTVLKNMSMGRSIFLKDPKDRPNLAFEVKKQFLNTLQNYVTLSLL